MRKLLIAAGVVPLLACSSEDFDRVQLARAQITELSHVVTPRLHRGAAVLTVSRQLRNDGERFEELHHTLAVPTGAVITSLRVGSAGRWQDESLLAVEEATSRWFELIGPGEAEPAPVALLQRGLGGEVELRLFGLAPRASITIEYELQLPLVYQAGGRHFDYRGEDSEGWLLAVPTFELSRISGARVEEEADLIRVRLPTAPIDRTEAKWALYPLGPERTIWRLELDAAPQLEPAPARPNVVFVVDASHSEGAEGIAAQLELLPGYLANVPLAQVEVVLYRRFAERLFGRFVPAAEVAGRVAASTEKLTPGNGSNLEQGARLAAQALAEVQGVGRIVLFTDERLRAGFSTEAAILELAAAPRDTVVHLVARSAGGNQELAERREDEHPLAPIAAAGGGIFLRVTGRVEDPALAASTLLGLVRPVRIDDFKIAAPGLEGDRLDAPEVLLEGESLRYSAIAARPPNEVTVTGKIWAREYRKVLTVDGDLAYWMPGLAIGIDELESQLSDEEVRAAAQAARAVSRLTSYLSAPPGAAPSSVGAAEISLGGFGWGTSHCGCGISSGSRCGGFTRAGPSPDHQGLLRGLLAPGVAACARTHGVPAISGRVRIEATADEIVEVNVAAPTPQLAACLTEVAWAVRLTGAFTADDAYEVDLAPQATDPGAGP